MTRATARHPAAAAAADLTAWEARWKAAIDHDDQRALIRVRHWLMKVAAEPVTRASRITTPVFRTSRLPRPQRRPRSRRATSAPDRPAPFDPGKRPSACGRASAPGAKSSVEREVCAHVEQARITEQPFHVPVRMDGLPPNVQRTVTLLVQAAAEVAGGASVAFDYAR